MKPNRVKFLVKAAWLRLGRRGPKTIIDDIQKHCPHATWTYLFGVGVGGPKWCTHCLKDEPHGPRDQSR